MTQPIDLDVNSCAETISADLKQSMHRAQSAHWHVFNFQVHAMCATRTPGNVNAIPG